MLTSTAASSTGGAAPQWPMVKCNASNNVDKWNNMKSVKVLEHFQETITDDDGSYEWVYTCKSCLAKELK